MVGRQYLSNTWVGGDPVRVYRILRGFFRGLVLGKNTLKVIELFPTYHCNSKCIMCSVDDFLNSARPEMTLEDYRRIAKEGADKGAIAMVLLGGEPLLSPLIDDIIRIFKKKSYFVTMVSNSLKFSPERARELRAAGLDSVYFSLESLDPAINDDIRGVPGHHASVMAAIESAKAAGLMVGLCAVILPGKLNRFREVLAYCAKHDLRCSGGEVAPVGAAGGADIVSAEENAEIRRLLSEHSRLTFDWGLSYFLRCRCPAGKEKIGVTCYGDIVGCSLTPISFGNVLTESLTSILNRMGRFSRFREDSSRCLAAADLPFINEFIAPMRGLASRPPTPYTEHPNMTRDKEKDLYD